MWSASEFEYYHEITTRSNDKRTLDNLSSLFWFVCFQGSLYYLFIQLFQVDRGRDEQTAEQRLAYMLNQDEPLYSWKKENREEGVQSCGGKYDQKTDIVEFKRLNVPIGSQYRHC